MHWYTIQLSGRASARSCSYDGYKALEQRAWVRVTAKVGYKFHNIYRGKGPVLTAVSVEPAEKPLEEVVTFS